MNYIALGFISLFGMIGLTLIQAGGYQNLYSNYGMSGYGQGYSKGYSKGYGSSEQAIYIPYPYYTPNLDGGYGGVSGGGLGGGYGDETGMLFMFFLLILLLANNNNSG